MNLVEDLPAGGLTVTSITTARVSSSFAAVAAAVAAAASPQQSK